MAWNYQTHELLNYRGPTPEHLVADASATLYILPQFITHLDSIHGIWMRFVGTRGGANITATVQESMVGGEGASWKDVPGATFTLGVGGVYGGAQAALDTEYFVVPPAGFTLKPHIRVKLVTDAATQFNLSRVQWTTRGLK